MVICLKLNQAQSQGQKDPSQSYPLGSRSQGLIQVALLALTEEGILIATGQSTGQASFLTGLQHNNNDQHQAGDHFQNSQNELQNFIFYTSLRFPPKAESGEQRTNITFLRTGFSGISHA